MSRRPIACGFLGLALVVSACGDERTTSGGMPSIPTTAPSSTSSTAPPSPTRSVPQSTAPQDAAQAPQSTKCVADSLAAKVEEEDAGAGQRYAKLVFTNIGTAPCTLTGYSGFQLLASGTAVPTSTKRDLDPGPTAVTVAPNASAKANLRWTVVPTGGESVTGPCEPEANAAAAIAPDDTEQIEFPWTFGPVCGAGQIQMSAFYPA
ncbi:DUF4232 domain-containing protein [Umezawaea endophytica]|uniref:DUF4232 domain-containing protein n=1 Tax=Umezawaea endophytica TaxID=1654476 RepID=A0A9X3A2F6_9PSEU|nr:DUF4232 domain-containing protein [Umezawaea endophytica]MCS7479008.1 DUF4232 domain-containing protein [Umezawaea endophytica]